MGKRANCFLYLNAIFLLLVGCKSQQNQASPILVAQKNKAIKILPQFLDRNYEAIPKGSYNKNVYIVGPKDTLFYIAWISGKTLQELAAINSINLSAPLTIGQKIFLSVQTDDKIIKATPTENAKITAKYTKKKAASLPLMPLKNTIVQTAKIEPKNSVSLNKSSTIKKELTIVQPQQNIAKKTASNQLLTTKQNNPIFATKKAEGNNPQMRWQWPTKGGKVITNSESRFSAEHHGIEIAAKKGAPVFATSAGIVVFAQNIVKGYGNLIIIKHNNTYLSAYAHNEKMLVKEKQQVKRGQKIATIGSTGTDTVKLYFEIRRDGEAVNPLDYVKNQ